MQLCINWNKDKQRIQDAMHAMKAKRGIGRTVFPRGKIVCVRVAMNFERFNSV